MTDRTIAYRGRGGGVTVQQVVAERVSFSYGEQPAVEDVSFRAGPGELVAIVGPNGCGKSTLLRLLLGEFRPASGRCLIDQANVAKMPRIAAARRLSLVPQFVAAPFGYSVREMVLMARHAAHHEESVLPLGGGGFETPEDLQLANESMWAADVHHLAERPIDQLSGGERQRVAIARALAQDTPVMLLDEPTSNLDLFHQLELVEELRRMTTEQGRIALLVTHDLTLAAGHAHRVLVMDRGRLVADGPPDQVLTPAILEPVYRVKVEKFAYGFHFSRMSP